MGQEDALMTQRVQDDDADFPEFEFPVSEIIDPTPVQPERIENGNGNGVRARVEESPKKMPGGPESPGQPEINKHVLAESESKIPNPVLASSRKVLSSNPSFKSLVTLLGEPLKIRTTSVERREVANGDEAATGESGGGEKQGLMKIQPPSTPPSKRLSGILARVNAKVDASKSPERSRPASSNVGVNVLVERLETFSTGATGARNPKLRDDRAVSPGPRNLASPRRVMAETNRARSPTPRQLQQEASARPMSSPHRGPRVERSVSPVPRSWKDSVYGDMPKERRPSLSKTDAPSTPTPRFQTPTQAGANTAKSPNSKSLQFTTAFGITTPVKQPSTPAAPRATPTAKQVTPPVTKPSGFNFRTDERAERRRDFYSKLEERLKAKEDERRRAEQKAAEEKEAQLRELRKSLTYKANPVPKFYQEPAPAPAEIQKVAPTRARSPNFTTPRRRDSCPASILMDLGRANNTSPLRPSRTLLRSDSSNSGGSNLTKTPSPKPPFRPV